jgi:hypothetical protein
MEIYMVNLKKEAKVMPLGSTRIKTNIQSP